MKKEKKEKKKERKKKLTSMCLLWISIDEKEGDNVEDNNDCNHCKRIFRFISN